MSGRYTGRVEAAEEDLDGWTCREPAAAVTSFAVVLEIAIEEEIGNFVFSNLKFYFNIELLPT
jgi:hypothetical protein